MTVFFKQFKLLSIILPGALDLRGREREVMNAGYRKCRFSHLNLFQKKGYLLKGLT